MRIRSTAIIVADGRHECALAEAPEVFEIHSSEKRAAAVMNSNCAARPSLGHYLARL